MEIARNNFNTSQLYIKYCEGTADSNNEQDVRQPAAKHPHYRSRRYWVKTRLEKLRFKYNAVFNNNTAHYIIMDKNLCILDFNSAAVVLVKKVVNKQIKVGHSITEYLDDELMEPIMESCRRALAGESFTKERALKFLNNRRTWWSAEYSPAYDADNNIAGLILNATDITARKNYEDRIELQNSKLRSISLMQSHDIRGPVCTLMGLINLIKMDNSKMAAEYLPMLEDTIKLLDDRIKNIVECAYEV